MSRLSKVGQAFLLVLAGFFRTSKNACPTLCILALPALSQSAIDRMPDLPQSYALRDWQQVARDFDTRVFDPEAKGEHLPLLWWDDRRQVNDLVGFAIPSYVGDSRQTPHSKEHEALVSMASILGATLAGIDKSDQHGRNYVAMLPIHFQQKTGIGLYLNTMHTEGDSFWYDLMPSLLFYQIYDHYPDTPGFAEQFVRMAEVWRQVKSFEHTGYNFVHKKPVDRGWIEADVAAGIACISYLAHHKTSRIEFLETAEHCLRWLDARAENPYYECLLPYGAYIAARSNAERGTKHDAAKLREWVLSGDNPRRWGAILEDWNGTPAHGLIGSVYPGYEFAFAMNTFQALGIMAPIVRYDESYAADFAKWALNVASNARFFYPNAWPAEAQSSYVWAAEHDPTFSIAYEGLRKQGMTRNYADDTGKIEFPDGTRQRLIVGVADPKQPQTIGIADSATGPFRDILSFGDGQAVKTIDLSDPSPIWLRGEAPERLVETHLPFRPHVGGDPTVHGWGETDLALYGGAFVGFLAALAKPTDVPGIIAIDPVATEVQRTPSYPTRLLRNPHSEPKTVTLSIGGIAVDLYDCLSNRFIAEGATDTHPIRLEAKQTVLLVFCPADGRREVKNGRLYVEDVVVDYAPH